MAFLQYRAFCKIYICFQHRFQQFIVQLFDKVYSFQRNFLKYQNHCSIFFWLQLQPLELKLDQEPQVLRQSVDYLFLNNQSLALSWSRSFHHQPTQYIQWSFVLLDLIVCCTGKLNWKIFWSVRIKIHTLDTCTITGWQNERISCFPMMNPESSTKG